jgi:hypothetical protein
MSRNFIPVALAIGVGVYTGIYLTFHGQLDKENSVLTSNFSAGYYTFQPAFQELAAEKTQGNGPATPQSGAGLNPGATAPPAGANVQSAKPASGTTDAEKNQ